MKSGDLVRVTHRDLIYTGRRGGGGNCIGAAGLGEIVMIIDDNEASYNVKILHPVYGPGFVTRAYMEVISGTG